MLTGIQSAFRDSSFSRRRLIAAASLLALVMLLGGWWLTRDGERAGDGSLGSLRITGVTFARDVSASFEPLATTDVFPTDTGSVWAVVGLENVSSPITVTGEWSYLGPDGKAEPSKLAEASVDVAPVSNSALRSGLQLIKDTFDTGVYQLEVLVDGEPARLVRFEVTEPEIAAPMAAAQAPEATPTPALPTPEPTPAVKAYVVQAGDSLAAIAAATGSTIEAIAAANNLLDPDALQPGQELVIP